MGFQWVFKQFSMDFNQISSIFHYFQSFSCMSRRFRASFCQVALRLCLATGCGQSLRHAELLLRVGVSLAKRHKQDLRKVLEAYEEAFWLL